MMANGVGGGELVKRRRETWTKLFFFCRCGAFDSGVFDWELKLTDSKGTRTDRKIFFFKLH